MLLQLVGCVRTASACRFVCRLHAQELQCQEWSGTVAVALYLGVVNNTDQVVFSVVPENVHEYTHRLLQGQKGLAHVLTQVEAWAKRVQVRSSESGCAACWNVRCHVAWGLRLPVH
jgi:hypothetical protein